MNKQSKEIPVKLKGWKRWAFPLIAMIIVPALFFILLELGLKVANYGFPTSFFVKRKVAEKTVYTDNRQYGWRFFPAKVARRPADIVLPAVKSEKAFRVFVLGESAAMGDPDTAYGIPRLLDVMLSERFPNVEVQVVNAAMTGISSHIIQDIAKDCAKFKPDCFVIYMGNNEAIGPYGPGTVFASFSRNLALTRLSINARSLKTSQLVDRVIRMRSKSEEPVGWGGLRVFMKSQLHPTDERVDLLAKHFETNLKDICETGRKAGTNLVLCTVASSLADCSPFASLNSPTLSADQKSSWDAQWAAADKFQADGKIEEALAAYEKAEAIDGSYADLHFRKGRLYTALKRSKEAQESFTLARDTDALKFRTSSDLNTKIKELAQSFPASDVALADVVKVIADESATEGVGSAHFVDHVHFSFYGNYVAAREIFNAVSRFVPGSGGTTSVEPLSEQACAERLAFSRWNQRKIAEHMLKRFEIPPFNTKPDSTERVQELKAQLAALPDESSMGAVQEALALYEKALQRKKTDPDFLRTLAELQGELENPAEEMKYREALYELYPYDDDRKALLAEAHARSGNYPEGEKLAREVLKVDSTHFIAHLALAAALEKKGSLEEAIKEYKEVLRTRPDLISVRQRLEALEKGGGTGPVYASPTMGGPSSPAAQGSSEGRSRYLKGEAYLQRGRIEEALSEFRTAVLLDSSLAEAHMAIAGILVEQGKVEEAIAQCKEGLRVRPDFTEMHSNVGALLTDLGRRAEARPHLEAAIRLDPNHSDAHLNLALNLMGDKRPIEALTHFDVFIKKNPTEADIHLQMGILYESTGSWGKAATSYREAMRIKPGNTQYQSYLAWILATSPQAEVRNGKEAVQLAEAACKTPTKEAYSLDTLAAAFAEMDRFPEAIKAAQEGLEIARAAKDDQMAEEIENRIALYKSNKPFRSVITAHTQP